MGEIIRDPYKKFSAVRGWVFLLLSISILIGCSSEREQRVIEQVPDVVDFNFHVKPILSDNCFACHGPDPNTREAGFRLDTEEGAFAPLGEDKDHFAIIRGKPANSELFSRIVSNDPDYVMPIPDSNLQLTDLEIAIIERWIQQGAVYEPHWSFISPELPELPEVNQAEWVLSPVDHFILEKLEKQGMEPSQEASREKLFRRVSFDLTGLPPTVEDLDAFLDDNSSTAYERAVDRLLASEAFGERMAMEWLDVARYADSHGYSADTPNHAWPWRDWVIKAFNSNMPFDQFTTLQLAGDLLPEATAEQKLATGFNRVQMQNQEGGINFEEFRLDYVKDRANTVGSTFLGLTMECASCHDHKYDPISEEEYYKFFAFFNNINETGATPWSGVASPSVLLPDTKTEELINYIDSEIAQLEGKLMELQTPNDQDFVRWLEHFGDIDKLQPDPGRRLIYLSLDNDVEGIQTSIQTDQVEENIEIEGSLKSVDGIQAGALEFSKGNYISMGDIASFERTDSFSFSLWVNPPDTASSGVVPLLAKNGGRGGRGYDLYLIDGRVSFRLIHEWPANALTVEADVPLTSGEWNHVALTYDGSSKAAGVDVYVNGNLQKTHMKHDLLFKNIKSGAAFVVGERKHDDQVEINFEGLILDEIKIYGDQLSPVEVLALADRKRLSEILAHSPERPTENLDRILLDHYLLREHREFQINQQKLHELRVKKSAITDTLLEAMVMQERINLRETFVLQMGRFDNPGEKVDPGVPASIMEYNDEFPKNRLGLAKWLVNPDNPLTARVTVNRYWQMLFGEGLVNTPSDFGSQGAIPTHPELLDWLAVSFVKSGWNVKGLIKEIVMSAVYRQSSALTPESYEKDPYNRLMARGPRYRLPAEMIRDQALSVSGLLVPNLGGPSVYPYQPEGIWEETTKGVPYPQGEGESLYRRSIYTFWKRSSPPPSMSIFDHPDRNVHSAERSNSTTPLQSLVTLNDTQFVEASRMLGERMMREAGGSIEDQITFAFRSLTSRFPQDEELELLLDMYDHQSIAYRENPGEAAELLTVGDFPVDEELPSIELAARTIVASSILNLYETIMKE